MARILKKAGKKQLVQSFNIGDKVNIEVDVIAKYVERFLAVKDKNNEG